HNELISDQDLKEIMDSVEILPVDVDQVDSNSVESMDKTFINFKNRPKPEAIHLSDEEFEELTVKRLLNSNSKTVLIAIFSTSERFERRALIRNTYLTMKPYDVDVIFVISEHPRVPDFLTAPPPAKRKINHKIDDFDSSQMTIREFIEYESKIFGDIFILQGVKENMDDGKTYEYFHQIWNKKFPHSDGYRFYMKTDDDVFLHLPNLVSKLTPYIDLQGVFFGRQVMGRTGHKFMAGMGYALSADLVGFIANDKFAASHVIGQEDALLDFWLRKGNAITYRIEADDLEFHDAEWFGIGWARPASEKSILIHRLKRTD
ncbi:hypothetical protein HK096_007827, partial [Nowakowskiella sp. JEL0078]